MEVGPSRSLPALAGVALLFCLPLSCASSKKTPDPAGELRTGIGEIVADPARAAKMLATVDEIEAAVREIDTLATRERASLLVLLRDYASSRAVLEASLAEFNTARESLARRVLTAHAALKADATAPEWKKLRKLEMEMITFAATQSVGRESAGKES